MFYFDNLLSGIPLLDYLKQLGHHGAGTIRENKIPESGPHISNACRNDKNERGHIEY